LTVFCLPRGVPLREFIDASPANICASPSHCFETNGWRRRSRNDPPTIRIICHYGVLDLEVAVAALLHDSLEDHADDLSPAGRDGTLAVLAARFGPRAAGLVGAVTNPASVPGIDKREQYREHVAALLRDGDPWAGIIKLADFTDNGIAPITARASFTRPARRRPASPASTRR
jgi:hypothetical protein